jgi:hypothetical protein
MKDRGPIANALLALDVVIAVLLALSLLAITGLR